MDKIPVYSPTQVGVSAFVGGPFAVVFTLWKNFIALGERHAATQTLIWGALFNVAVLAVIPVLPDKFPNTAIPIAYTVAAYLMARRYQLTKQAIRESEQYRYRSNWNVFGISVGFMLLFLAVIALWLFGLSWLGLIKLE
jgi:hypothetical protein